MGFVALRPLGVRRNDISGGNKNWQKAYLVQPVVVFGLRLPPLALVRIMTIQEWLAAATAEQQAWYQRHYRPEHDALIAAILADPDLKELAEQGLDSDLSVHIPPRLIPKSTIVTRTGLAAIIGEVATAGVMVALRTAAQPASQQVSDLIAAEIDQGRLEMLAPNGTGIDLSLDSTRSSIADLVSKKVLTVEHQSELIAASTDVVPYSVDEVSASLLPFRFDCRAGGGLP